jgi:putative DNA primase/helicase
MSFEKMMLLQGDPRCGKGTVMEMTSNIIGLDQCASTTFDSLVETFGLEPLLGKLLCTFGDIRNPRQDIMTRAMERMLGVVGADPMPINRKGVTGLPQVRLKVRFMMAMNEIPSFIDHTRAMESRLLVLKHFGSHVDDADPRVKKRVVQEAKDGKLILHALEGLKRLRENNEFTIPESSEEIMQQFRSISAPVATFLGDCCTIEEGSMAYADAMFETWSGWCRTNARKSGLPEQFAKWLLGHAPTVKRGTFEDGDRVARVFNGIKIQDWAFERYAE